MTKNSIDYKKTREDMRANRAKERLTSKDLARKQKEFEHKEKVDWANVALKGSETIGKTVGSFVKNDPQWYTKYRGLTNPSALVNFNTIMGNQPLCKGSKRGTIPGIYVYEWIPTIGSGSADEAGRVTGIEVNPGNINSAAPTSPIIGIARNICIYMQQNSGRSQTYDPCDVAQVILALDSVYSAFCEVDRLIKISNMYSVKNKYLGRAMIQALGYNYDDLIDTLPNLIAMRNKYAVLFSQFVLPAGFSFIERHNFLNSAVFKDSAGDKCQFMMYKQAGFFVYHEESSQLKGQVEHITKKTKGINTPFYHDLELGDLVKPYSRWKLYFEQAYEGLVGSETVQVISSDILRNFKDNVFKIGYLEPTVTLTFVEDISTMNQMRNMQIVPLGNISGVVKTHDGQPSSVTITPTDQFTVRQNAVGDLIQGYNQYLPATCLPGHVNDWDILPDLAKSFGFAICNQDETFEATGNPFDNHLILSKVDNPGVDEIMEATRLQVNMCVAPLVAMQDTDDWKANSNSNTIAASLATHYGTELVIRGYSFRYIPERVNLMYCAFESVVVPVTGYDILSSFIADIKSNDYMPTITLSRADAGVINFESVNELDNYGYVSKTQLSLLHYAALYSEFYLDGIIGEQAIQNANQGRSY